MNGLVNLYFTWNNLVSLGISETILSVAIGIGSLGSQTISLSKNVQIHSKSNETQNELGCIS